MDSLSTVPQPVNTSSWYRIHPSRQIPSLKDDANRGLLSPPRMLSPKYFYDKNGSRLFTQICEQPEYYPIRTENALLAKWARDIVSHTLPQRIIELGAGDAHKIRHIIHACQAADCYPVYAPFDIDKSILAHATTRLTSEYPWLQIQCLVGDFTAGLEELPQGTPPDLYIFLGGTIGNFEAPEAHQFLRDIRANMAGGDHLLIGADRIKEPDILHAAYNDKAGKTEQFNLNMLRVLNHKLQANFDLAAFAHYAFFNPVRSRIEMHLIARNRQHITLGELNKSFHIDEGEHILTEISQKFTYMGLSNILGDAGFRIVRHFEPDDNAFSLILAQPA